jgi:hypothetical protein
MRQRRPAAHRFISLTLTAWALVNRLAGDADAADAIRTHVVGQAPPAAVTFARPSGRHA